MSDRWLRYVILRHEVPPEQSRASHWDLLVEWDRDHLLLTWELENLPASGQLLSARPLAPHRRRYLDYEGPLTEGRGSVTRWDAGDYCMVDGERDKLARCQLATTNRQSGHDQSADVPADGQRERPDPFQLRLVGNRLQGELTLQPPSGDDQFWKVSFTGNIAVR